MLEERKMFNQEQLSKMSDEHLTQLKDPQNSDRQVAAIARNEINRRKTLQEHDFNLKLVAEQNKVALSSAKLLGKYTIISAVLGAVVLCLLTYIATILLHSQSDYPQKPVEKTNTILKTKSVVETNEVSFFTPP